MIENAFYTPAVAKILENQGHLEEAAQVYRKLLSEMPGHAGFREALAGLESRLAGGVVTEEGLTSLFAEWLGLLSGYGRLKQLRNFDPKRGR